MRLARTADAKNLASLYTEAATYAQTVGHIDWENPFPIQTINEFIAEQKLFCSYDENGLPIASARLTHEGNEKIWQVFDDNQYLYVSKLATANSLHGTGYVADVMFPDIIERASQSRSNAIRLDCLADNPRLIRYYSRLGFSALGIHSFYSEKQQRMLAVMKFEMPV